MKLPDWATVPVLSFRLMIRSMLAVMLVCHVKGELSRGP